MLVYKDEAAALDLYNDDSPEAFLILGAALPALAGPQPGPAFKVFFLAQLFMTWTVQVLVVRPEDADFDVNLVARQPGAVLDLEMVKVRPGQQEKYKRLRDRYKVRARSSSNIQEVQVFRTVPDLLESLPAENPFRFPAADNEVTLTVYPNAAARAAALAENLKVEIFIFHIFLNPHFLPAGH